MVPKPTHPKGLDLVHSKQCPSYHSQTVYNNEPWLCHYGGGTNSLAPGANVGPEVKFFLGPARAINHLSTSAMHGRRDMLPTGGKERVGAQAWSPLTYWVAGPDRQLHHP